MNKKIASEIAVGVILLIAIAVGGIFWMQNRKIETSAPQVVVTQQKQEVQPVAQSVPADETANWQTYENDKWGYSFMAPKNFAIEEEKQSDAPAGKTLADIAKKDVAISGDYNGDYVIINTNIGNHNIDDGKCIEGDFVKIVTADNQNIEICRGDNSHADFYSRILKTGMFLEVSGDNNKTEKTQEIFDKIISTFKFKNETANWKLISGNKDDTCTTPIYNGNVQVKGWYEMAVGYTEKEWMLAIDDSDVSKLPEYSLGNDKTKSANRFVKLIDATPELEQQLKNASKENPATLTLKGYSLYCEGSPVVSLGQGSQILKK